MSKVIPTEIMQSAMRTVTKDNFDRLQFDRRKFVYDRVSSFLKSAFSNPAFIIAMKYVIFFLALLFLFLYLRGALGGRRGRPVQPGKAREHRTMCQTSAAGCRRTFAGIPLPGARGYYRTSEFTSFDPRDYATLADRPAQRAGRCDNAEWVEAGARCLSAALPPPIEWKLKLERGAGYKGLTKNLRQVIAKFDTIVVPWAFESDYLVPDCGAAYYKADDERRAIPGLQDQGDTCRLKPVAPFVYSDRVRHKDAALDDFSEVEEVDCGGGQCD